VIRQLKGGSGFDFDEGQVQIGFAGEEHSSFWKAEKPVGIRRIRKCSPLRESAKFFRRHALLSGFPKTSSLLISSPLSTPDLLIQSKATEIRRPDPSDALSVKIPSLSRPGICSNINSQCRARRVVIFSDRFQAVYLLPSPSLDRPSTRTETLITRQLYAGVRYIFLGFVLCMAHSLSTT